MSPLNGTAGQFIQAIEEVKRTTSDGINIPSFHSPPLRCCGDFPLLGVCFRFDERPKNPKLSLTPRRYVRYIIGVQQCVNQGSVHNPLPQKRVQKRRPTMSAQSRSAALTQAIAAALPSIPLHAPSPLPAQPRATETNTAQQIPPEIHQSNPPRPAPSSTFHPPSAPSKPKPLKPLQLSAARLLLAGHSVIATAAALKIHPYTLSRWKRNPLFHAELRRQTDALARNAAQQKQTPRNNFSPFLQNEATRQSGTRTTPPFSIPQSSNTPNGRSGRIGAGFS